jgi:hypothetical protein
LDRLWLFESYNPKTLGKFSVQQDILNDFNFLFNIFAWVDGEKRTWSQVGPGTEDNYGAQVT